MALYQHIASVVQSVAGSTCSQDYPELPAFVEQHLNAMAGRAEAAALRRDERSADIRGAIRKAAGALSMEYPLHQLVAVVARRTGAASDTPGWIPSVKRCQNYGLKRPPGIETIRDELRAMQIQAGFGSETIKTGCYASTATCST